ncbi:hypothetical protein [Histophilus somni]|uniref:hypothetical protein n=1 Tax=Histophilus somni TaxID=731 RepID=UPI00201F7088|nr:hypothetical protein [Histophilus somni]
MNEFILFSDFVGMISNNEKKEIIENSLIELEELEQINFYLFENEKFIVKKGKSKNKESVFLNMEQVRKCIKLARIYEDLDLTFTQSINKSELRRYKLANTALDNGRENETLRLIILGLLSVFDPYRVQDRRFIKKNGSLNYKALAEATAEAIESIKKADIEPLSSSTIRQKLAALSNRK